MIGYLTGQAGMDMRIAPFCRVVEANLGPSRLPDPALVQLLTGKVSAAFPAVPADVSVTLGRVNLANGTVDAFADRHIVFSNPLLWQVVVCLAQPVGAIQGAILRYSSGDNQTAAPGAKLANPLVVELVDGGGNPVAGSLVQFQTAGGSATPGQYRDR